MSVAAEFPPVVYVPVPMPSPARRPGVRTAKVLAFRPPAESGSVAVATPPASLREAANGVPRFYPVRPAPARPRPLERTSAGVMPVRLTRRGYVVAGVLALALIVGLVWLAHASAGTAAPPAANPPAVVTVDPGDTLWSIASRVAPQRDPRAVVAELERVNHLSSPILQPGQRLRTR